MRFYIKLTYLGFGPAGLQRYVQMDILVNESIVLKIAGGDVKIAPVDNKIGLCGKTINSAFGYIYREGYPLSNTAQR